MKLATVLTVVAMVTALGLVAIFGLASGGHSLEERWTSDTARENRVNHHPIAVAAPDLIAAPVAAVGGSGPYEPTSCALVRLAPDDGDVRWRNGIAPANCTSHAITGPAIADIDSDGNREIIFASTERSLHVVDAETGNESWRLPIDTYGYSPPRVADLDGDGASEIVVADIGGSVSLIVNRSVQWQRDFQSSTWATPLDADLDTDGQSEIVVGTNDQVIALSMTGDRLWAVESGAVDTGLVPASEGPPLILAANSGTIKALDARSGDDVWERTGSWTPAIGDISSDAASQTVYAGLSGGRVIALDARTGERLWSTVLIPEDQRVVTPRPVLGDVDGDGNSEVVAVTGTGTVAVLDADSGEELASYERNVPILTHVTLGDVTDNGAAEIFVRYGDGRVVSLEYQ